MHAMTLYAAMTSLNIVSLSAGSEAGTARHCPGVVPGRSYMMVHSAQATPASSVAGFGRAGCCIVSGGYMKLSSYW